MYHARLNQKILTTLRVSTMSLASSMSLRVSTVCFYSVSRLSMRHEQCVVLVSTKQG